MAFISQRKTSGTPEEWIKYAEKMIPPKPNKKWWNLVLAPGHNEGAMKIQAGDILINKSHVMIAMKPPNKRNGGFSLRIADSTSMPKHKDDRGKKIPKETGMGTGTIYLRNDGEVLTMEKHNGARDPQDWKELYVLRPVSK